uniref:Dystonin n=1 Tax=Corvus moneduloides TaxID=1196302 RepID=A0A8C3EZK3_CORMO
MIAAAFLVLLRPYSIQCALFLLLLLLGTIATILFFCCWHRRLQKGRHPIKSVFSGRSRSRGKRRCRSPRAVGFRSSPRHARRRVTPRLEETQPIVEAHHLSEQETSVRKRKIKKSSRVQPDFYHSVQVTPTRKPSSGNASYRCSMSSSADFSDEEDFSQRSGTVSPAPGDTLPWNLPKHERSKRKIHGGSVLDPAERAVLRIADERDKVQKKTFTKWINQHLMKVRKHVNDLYEDLRDGHNLISLLEVLSGDTLPREKGRMRFHRLQNVQIALDYLKKRQVKLVNIRNDDITDGNPKLTLGLIWTIILHFQISDIHVTGESEDMSAKERLLLWSQQTTEGYAGIHCENFTTCWRDGRLFNAIIHKYRPDLIDMSTVAVQSNLANLEHAFFVAEKLGVARLLDPEDVDVSSPDEKSVITYVSSLYDAFPKVPEGGEGISANDVEVKWVEYQNMVNYLMQWIRHHVTIMSDRTFPNNPVELKALYNQYLQFKETEIPPKETDKSKIKHLYKLLEVWIEFGRIKLSQGYHPNDIEKEWGKLIIAMLEREKTLRPEVERLEMLQQIANRIQRDSRSCEDKLILARNALQSDTKRLESGLQFQHEAEIAGYLLESENLLRQQVIDAQILIDGKYYQADQLVQRVAKLRDELMAIRTECSSVYNKGHALTTEQTKLMISGITESLNSGFTTNLTPELNAAMTQGLTPTLTSSSLTSGLSSGLTSRLTPTITPTYPPGIPPRLIQSYVTGVDSGALQTLKLMQIRKPLMKSAFVDQNLTEEEVNMKFVQDLLSWVEEMQVQLDRAEWGSDLPSVESHLENHKNVHKAIEEFESSLKEAKISEIQMTAPLKLSYTEKLHKLESQYSKLLNTSRNQERHLDTLHNFVSRATRELIWLNEKEEEEVAYDWSERNPNIARKKEYHAELMRELDEKEEVIKSVQEIAEQLLLENHPARLTIEAYRAAMQTQWSWILQLCHCVEQHLRENAAYFEFFSDAKEAMEYLKNLKDTIYRKYSCDRSSSLHRLEDLVQESMEEKEQLLQYKSTVAGLVGRAKAIIQLKPRNPDCVLKTSIPIKAICDYRQIEITIYKDDECVLANNSHRAKWKVISPSGNEAMVPSVCFTGQSKTTYFLLKSTYMKIEQQFQNVLALWHESHVNMKSVVSWHYLTNEIEAVRAGNVASIKTMLPGEHQQVLSNLQSRFDDFVEDSQESKIFTSSDTAQLEREVNVCKQYYQELLKSAEREEQEESIYNLYISEVRNIRLRLESCEERLIRQIRTPMERDDVHENVLRISEQEKLKKELDRLKDDLGIITDKCEEFFSQAAGSPSVPTLRSELNVVIQNMNQVYSMSSIFIDKLKNYNLVRGRVTADKNNIENLMQWRSEVDEKRQTFHALEDELQKAKMISDQMFKMHKERDLDFDWHKEKVDQLAERWQNVHSQIENRFVRDLEGINKSLKYYKDTYNSLDTWIQQVEDTQRKIQEIHPENSKALAKQLNQHKILFSEIEMKQSKIDGMPEVDYELQTMTYRAMVDSQQKSPVKRRRMQSSSDFIIQEFMDLRTRYTALVTLMTQYIKFAGDSLKRLEEEEKSVEEEKKEHVEKAGDLLKWVSNLSKTLGKEEGEKAEKTDLPKQQISLHEMSTKKEQIAEALQTTQSFLAKHSDKMTDEERNEMEKQVRSLQESYSLLSNEALKQLQEVHLGDEKMEEKVNKVIAGVIDQTTGEVISVFQSILRGFLDYDTGIRLLENQLILSGIISPELGVCYDLEEAEAHALIDEQILLHLQELSNAKKLMSESSLANIPVVSALEQGLISEPLAVKILENQLSSGYLILPSTGEKLSLQNAFQKNLISPTLYAKLLERKDTCKDLIDPNCAEKISLEQMVHRSIIHEATGLRLLTVKPQEKGRIMLKCGRRVTILRAAHEGLIDRETMFRLLGAQLMSGGIIDPDSGKRMTVEEAMRQGMIDQDTACGILTHQVKTGGILCQNSGQRLTVDEAVQCNLISSTSALLVLEAQRGFVGLIWPHTGEIFPVSTSLHQDMITNELAFKILTDRKKIAALYIPETCEIISLDKAAESGIIDSNTVSVLTNVTLPDKMPNVEELKSPCKNAAKWLSTYEFLPSVCHDCEEEHEDSGTEDHVCHNLDQAKKLFMSYLMVNSYMDANTGGRLLLYDGQLQEVINMLLEGDRTGYNAGVSEMELSNKYVSSKGINLKSVDSVQGDISGAENFCNNRKRNELRGFLEVSEWTELKHNNQQTNLGNIEGYLPNDSNTCLISETANKEICVGDSLDNENRNDKMLQNSLSVNDLSDNETWRELERCTEYGPHIFQADSSRMVQDSSKKDNFQRGLGSSISADTECRLPEELVSQCGVPLKFEDNGYGEQPLQEYGGPSLEGCPCIHGRPSLEDCTDFRNKLCLGDSIDMHHRPSLGGDTVMHDGPPLGDSNSTAQRLTVEESDLVFHKLVPCDSSSDSSIDGGDGIPQLESNCLQHKFGEVASEEDSSQLDDGDDDDAYETPQGDDDDSDVYDTPQIDDDDDDDDSSDTSRGDEGFDTLQLGDDDKPEPELAGRSVPLGFLEERGGRITLRKETSSFQELAANAGENVCANVKGQPETITIASANAKTMEKIPEERERMGSFGEKEQELPVTVENEGRKEGAMSYLWNMCEGDVQDRNEEVEMKAGGDLCGEEYEGTQEEDYEEDYDSYDDSDTDSDSEKEMDIFYSHHQCISKGDQLLISVEDVERSNENNQNIDDCCHSLDHKTGYTLHFQSNHENGKLSSVKCESMSNVSEERCVGLSCTSEEDRQEETEDDYGTFVKSKHMSQDTPEPVQSENTFDTKWISTKSEESNETQFRVPGSQLLDDTVKSDITVTAYLQQATDDDESTWTNLLLSECFTDSVNKDSNTMPMLDSNHGERKREALFAEEKVLNYLEQLKESSSQMHNKIPTDIPYLSDNSSLSDPVHPVTSWKHGQIERGFENLTENKNRLNIMEACDVMGLSNSPIQMESLGAIFDATVIKADRETPVASEGKVNVDQAFLDIQGARSDEFKRDVNISASLKQHTTCIKEGGHSELDKTEFCFEDMERGEEGIQNEKDFLLNVEEMTFIAYFQVSLENLFLIFKTYFQFDGVQHCLKLTEKMREHLAVLQDMRNHLDKQQPISNSLEILKAELEQLESFESGLATFAIILKKDMNLAEEFLKSCNRDIPEEKLKELKISCDSLQEAFLVVCDRSSKRAKQIVSAVDLEMSKLAGLHQQLLNQLHRFSDWITENSKIMHDFTKNTTDIEEVKKSLQLFKNSAAELSCKKMQLESTAFDVQFFISEHAEDLSPNQSKQLLRLLNTTQKSFQEAQEAITSQVESLETQLQAVQELGDQKAVAERQQECKEKLQEICDLLTQTENRLIGQQESLVIGDSKAELEQYQTKQEEIQKDMRTSAQTLAEIVKNTETFLKENGEKLSQEDKTVLEQKLNEAKTKCLLLSQKAEESKKELDKAMTTAIKQETEKVAAIEQLEESKNTIENLLDWLSNVDKEAEHGRKFKQVIEQNGTHFEEGDVKVLEGEEDDVNGNLLEMQQDIETRVDGLVKSTDDNLNQQYQKVKAQHEKIISQQQAIIVATQSAQALLEKQGHYLTPEEKDKMQRNMKELKAQYETALAESERKMKLTHSLREELEKFDADYSEFETWLQQAEQELDNLEAGASDFSGIMVKLKRQKSFSEDVISHKGDLRYITISGQRVLDAARSCSKRDGVKVDKDGIDTSATYAEVQNKLDRASDRFKSLYTKCSILGNNLKDLVDKYQHYEDASSGLLSGLQASEIAVNKQLSEPIAVDPKNLQRQLEETKVLQGQVSNHQIAVEKLKKAAEVLLDTRGELTPDKDEIQKTLDDIVERYDNLSKSVNERNEKLQVTLTRSLSVQDGLDEMLDWMEGVEKSLKEQDQVPLNSAAIQDIISKSIMLEQDIAGRQSSINTMNEKVKKFMETADPSTASTLQAKMSELSGRFSEASNKHREKLMKMEELKTKVELFEGLSEKLQSFLDEKNQALSETEAPRKDVSEVSQYMQEASVELAQHKKDLEVLKKLLEELSFHALPGDKALVLEKVNALSKKFKEVEETIKEKEEDVSSCQKEMDTFELLVESLKKWIKETTERIPAAQPSLNTEELKKPLEDTLVNEWTLKAPELQKMNSRGTLLCNLITAVTSPAKLRAVAKSGGTILNGEGGAPGTQDFLKNKELTTVQQAMSNVNHSYEDLGVLLNEKISELESMLSKMQNIQEESASMMHWLQKMDKTASDWEAAPTDSEAVKAQVEQHKLFETELKQSANKVQELKDKVTELLEKNPDSPEAPKWRQTLDKIDSKWKELNQVTSERQQKLEESSNYLTQFQTAEAQLKHWLVEKELMVSVLGPLSIDPNMLNTQKQQVQILLKEFDTRKPQYEQLTMAGEGILERPGEHPPSHEIVKEQLAAVAQKWDSLTSQLKKRCDRIDLAIVKSTEYQSLLRSLSDKLSALDSKLSSSLAVSTQPDAVKQQLEIAKEMKEEIEQEMKNINAAQALCEELSTLVGEEYLKAELTRQLDGILKSFKDIEQKSDNHVQQLQSAYATSHQFQQMSKDFQAWISKKKEELNQARPVSAKLDVLQSLIEEQKDFTKTMSSQISSYERIVAEGESILQKTQGADKTELQSQIAILKNNWEEMNKQVKEREDKLADCLEKALKYKQHVENLQPWIEKCQSNLYELKVGINPVEIEDSIVQVRAWQKDLDKHHGMVELLNNSAESLLNASQTDKEIVEEETKKLNQNVKVVTEELHKKRDCLENMAQRLKEFQDSSRETERQLRSAKDHLEAHDSLGPQSFSNKHLTMMQAQQKALQALKPHVDLAKKLAQDLVVEASDSAGVSDLLLQAESLEQEYTAVKQQVEDRCSFLETKLQGIGHFQNSIREMFSQFAEFDDELDSMAPVGRDVNVLQSQREDIKHFMKKLEDLIMNNENANKNCKIMLATEAEASPDLVGIKRDLEALNKQCNKLLDRAKAREDQVDGTICRVEEFYSKLKEFSTLLGRAEEHEESQGPVGMETEAINQQLNTFKVFQKEEIEPLQVKQQEVNWLGQGLIQSAAKSTNTENLEHDLEDVNTRWKTLNKKVAQRAAQLQEALLHCGRFQDALESLLSWLIDTEDLVANQKPPSAEFKVVKAQIQEQKLLQRLLDDRKPTVEAIKREGEKIAESAEPADRVKILKQLSFLDSRWDALLSKAETRNRQLEGISVVAQQFHEALEPLVEWLTATEKRLANAEPIGTQASKLQQQISQHKALEDDVLAHNKSLHQAISAGQSLKTMSSREDKDMVQEKLDSAQARYIEIQEKSNSRCELLQQAYSNAQIFGEDEVELMNWLNEIHDKLNKLSVQDCNTELLEKQHSELLDLQEEILLRKQSVDLAIQNGLELLKQTTGDEVVIVQDKLEGIKARYKDITKLSSDVSKTLEQALQLAGQLHSTHEELCKWLDEVEMELLSYETQVPKAEELSQVQERQKELKKEAKNNKGLLDSLNEVGSAFLELVPWRAREGLDKMITEDNERYRLVSDTISQKVDEIDAAILRSQQFDQAADAEFAWIAETEKKLMSLGDIRLEQDQTTAQLQVQKAFTMEILRHKDTIDELVKSGDKLMKTCTEEEKQMMKKKIESLLQKYDAVCQMNSERNLQLERAQSLVNQFWETYEELWPWLTETEMIISQLPAPALEYETLKQQQEEHRQLRELIAEHKPHIDKMNKTGPQLLELSPGEGFSIQEKYVAADTLYSKIKEDVKKRALALDEAISQCTQFHDKIDPTLESLKRIVERLRQPPSISAEVEKIKEQISENKNVSVELEKLQPVYETLKQRGEEMIARSEGADKDISAKAVQDKLDQMVLIWEDIQTLAEEREAKLLDVMELAEKFWCDHMALVATIKDTQDFIRELEGPGVDPSVVKQQQEAAEAAKEEIDGLQEELEAVVSLGSELRAACGEPDKPIVNKSIDELNSAWDALNKTWKERVDKLGEAMQAAVQYQDGLQALFDWVDIAGSKLASMSPVGTDLETVKQQTEELKQFKTEAYQQQIEMERLNHQAELLLKKATQESDKHTVQDPLSELRLLWDSLEDKIISRQHKLEGALLALGQFQHALDELLAWLTHTEDLLNEQKPVGGDPKAIEIELAKHHVLQNDVLAHQSTVEAVKKAGNDLIESSAVEEASNLRSKLELLNQCWQNLLEKTEQRKQQLDSALIQAQGFHGEVEDLQQWLTDTERQLLASKPVGGLPETAREQLNAHMELCAAFEAKEETYKCLMQKGQQMLARCPESAETNVEQDINNLKEKWESVQTKLSERKTKLEEALNLAMEFHNSLQDFINWLTQAEQTLTAASRPSLILDTVLFQIDEHKVFATEVNSHRDQIIELDKTGTHLKYFSQKQDVVLIKNLLISVQSRWEKVVQRLVERGRALDDARKRAKQFHEAWHKLMEWLEESEKSLDSDLEIANDPDKIKMQLAQHKEFQKSLGAKHSVYDTTNRTGRSLKEKTTLADDNLKLDDMLSELRDKWDTICGKSVERQNKLEEALLFSGQFTDALQALIDWLYKIEPQLAEDQPVHGDIDLVMNLIDNHKVFQKELGKRTSSVQALKRSARELTEGSRDDSSWVKVQMQELSTRWETVCALSVSKQTRLEQALRQAEEFHSVVHVLLEWLAEAEQALRFHGVLPDDEEALRTLIEQHREFMKKLEEKKAELNKATGMGEAILAICHPDSITTIKHWITIIRARFEEVLAWAKQHQQRLAGALAALIANQELLEALLSWLQWAETTLTEKDKEVIPQEIEEVKALIAEHQTFMEEMTRKQPDVDKVTKTYKRKALEPSPVQSHIPVLDKGRAGRKRSPTPGIYPSAAQAQIETKNPRVNLLVSKWQQVWLLALERRRKLNDALDRLEELREFANFDFDIWRKKYMRWMNHKKSRVMDFFRRIDKDQDGKITRQEFIDGILSSKFPTSRLEMSAVADIFDRDGDGYIDYYEFVAALHPNKDAYKPLTDADKIEDEVTRQVAKCKCAKRFQVEQIGDNKYRVSLLRTSFGDSQQLRLVRILRSTVMVRVGGGWMALDEFLVKNDPCRVHHHGSKMLRSESNSSITTQPTIAKGRTNVELREKFILADGASQSMAAFRPRGRRSRPSSRGASPNRSTSLSSQAGQAAAPQAVTTSTPKTPHHLTRNYGKPWLTNSKTSTPSKPPESSDYQGSSAEGTPIQGSKLRLPGYLSGKGFHSGEDSGILSTAATRVRAQFAETRRTPSRPGSRAGSKAGSRSSSRRGSDASDFDISEIQSVCSDMSETVPATSRPTPRAGSRPGSAKPSKIPTPQRRPLASKLDKSLKR